VVILVRNSSELKVSISRNSYLEINGVITLTESLLTVALRSIFPTTPEKSSGLIPGSCFTFILAAWLMTAFGIVW